MRGHSPGAQRGPSGDRGRRPATRCRGPSSCRSVVGHRLAGLGVLPAALDHVEHDLVRADVVVVLEPGHDVPYLSLSYVSLRLDADGLHELPADELVLEDLLLGLVARRRLLGLGLVRGTRRGGSSFSGSGLRSGMSKFISIMSRSPLRPSASNSRGPRVHAQLEELLLRGRQDHHRARGGLLALEVGRLALRREDADLDARSSYVSQTTVTWGQLRGVLVEAAHAGSRACPRPWRGPRASCPPAGPVMARWTWPPSPSAGLPSFELRELPDGARRRSRSLSQESFWAAGPTRRGSRARS